MRLTLRLRNDPRIPAIPPPRCVCVDVLVLHHITDNPVKMCFLWDRKEEKSGLPWLRGRESCCLAQPAALVVPALEAFWRWRPPERSEAFRLLVVSRRVNSAKSLQIPPPLAKRRAPLWSIQVGFQRLWGNISLHIWVSGGGIHHIWSGDCEV